MIDKENLAIRNNYAYYLALREKNLQFAKELSKNTIEAEPANSTYLDTYGYILYRMGKLKEARKYISRALNSGGGSNAEILMHYGDILHAMSRQKEAVEIWTRALDYADIELKIELESKIQGTDIIESK
jgi:tetratricopeptide (TPR) repeat protein